MKPKFNKTKTQKKSKRRFQSEEQPNTSIQDEKGVSSQSLSEIGQTGSNPNDPSWYGKNKLLSSTLGLINFSEYKGTANHLVLQTTAYDGSHLIDQRRETFNVYNRFPGIMIHDFAPTFGSLNTSGNDAEEMARIIYATIRRTISGRRNYDATTVLQYILAVGSLQSAFGELHRILAAVRNRSLVNRYYGERLAEALGYSYDDIVFNYNKYAFTMNQVALTADTLALPKGLDLFAKWYWLNSSVFSDSEDPRSGLIAFVSHGFWVWRNLKNTSLNLDHIKQEVAKNHAPNLGTSMESAQLTPGHDTDLAEFAPYGLVFEHWPGYQRSVGDESRGSRFENILNTLRRAAFEYIDNHDFNLVAADLRKAYGDDVVSVKQFVPDSILNITYDPLLNASTKNIVYAPFYPMAALEFPAQAWESRGHRNGLVYVMQTSWDISLLLNNAATKQSDGTIKYSSIFTSPQTTYVYSKWEMLDPETAMDMLKWQIRYRITGPMDGNVILYRDSTSTDFNPGAKVGLAIETMGTEIITGTRIFGIIDHLRGLGDSNSEAAFTELSDSITTYGQVYYYLGASNFLSLTRYYIPKADAARNNLDDERRNRYEYDSIVTQREIMAFIAWARHWDSAPALYFVIPGVLFSEPRSRKLLHWSDIMALNPWPHYAVLDGNIIRRHHDVALASLLGIGTWGSGSINSEQSRPSQALPQSSIKDSSTS